MLESREAETDKHTRTKRKRTGLLRMHVQQTHRGWNVLAPSGCIYATQYMDVSEPASKVLFLALRSLQLEVHLLNILNKKSWPHLTHWSEWRTKVSLIFECTANWGRGRAMFFPGTKKKKKKNKNNARQVIEHAFNQTEIKRALLEIWHAI